MSNKLKTTTSIILYLIKNSESKSFSSWIDWRETVLAVYERKIQSGVINTEINSGKINSKKIKSLEDVIALVKDSSLEEQIEMISLIELYRIVYKNSPNYIPGSFNTELFDKILSSISDSSDIRDEAINNAETWFELKRENRFYTEIYLPASVRPILFDFILRCFVLWGYQNWGWNLLGEGVNIISFYILQLVIIPIVIFIYANTRDKKTIKQTQSLITKIDIENLRIRINNTAWHYLLLFILLLAGSIIMLLVKKLEIETPAIAILGLFYGIYLLMLQTIFSKQTPTYLNIKQQIEDIEHRELSGELTPDQNDEEIINLEVNLKAENERMNAYVIEAALFGALAFSGYLQLVAEGGLSFSSIVDFNNHVLLVLSNIIDSTVDNISLSYAFLLSKNGIVALLSYQLLLCSIFFLAVIASRLRFSKLTDYVDRFLQLSKAMNVKEEYLIQNDKTNTEAINYYNIKIKDLLRKGYKKQDEIFPIMEYMQFFRTLGIVMFFIIIITGGLFISQWISMILFFISALSLFYFHLGKLRNGLKSIYISMQEFYYRTNTIIHWVCWSMIFSALLLRTFGIQGGVEIMIIGFLLLFLHYLMNLFIPVQFDYEIKNSDDAYGLAIKFHTILAYLFKIALALFFMGYMLKAFHLPYAGLLLYVSIFMMGTYFLIVPKLKKGSSWIGYVLGISILVFLLTAFSKFMYLPSTRYLYVLLVPLVFASVIITYLKRNQIRSLIKRIILILFLITLGSFSE